MPRIPKKQKRRGYLPKRIKSFGNKAYPFYNSQTWRKLSRRHRVNNPMCEIYPNLPAQLVDHIIPIEVDDNGQPLPTGGAPYDERNLMSMSHKAHNKKRGKEAHGFQVEATQTATGLIPKRRDDLGTALRS